MICLALISAACTAAGQTAFRAELTSTSNPDVTGVAAFTFNPTTSTVSFTIAIRMEQVVPTTARLIAPQGTFEFDLGTPLIVVHSPGPWPAGYDGATAFFGSFQLPTELRADFVAGQVVLELLNSRLGDFRGTVARASAPTIAQSSRPGSTMKMVFQAEAPYQYTVEYFNGLADTNTVALTNVTALSQPFEATVSDPASAPARFYRLRRSLCCDGLPR